MKSQNMEDKGGTAEYMSPWLELPPRLDVLALHVSAESSVGSDNGPCKRAATP